MITIGAQLYTVREALTTSDEIKCTLQKIKNIGYSSVQLFGSMDLIEECAKASHELGIKVVGILADLNICENNEKALFEICKKYSIPDLGISSSPEEYAQPDPYIKRVNAFASKAQKAGLTFSYHNHGHEFIQLADGETAMNHFLKKFDTQTVFFMPDTYWIHDGGYDVRYFLEQTKNRVQVLHLKDMKRTAQGQIFAEIGSGNLYFPGILKEALEYGIQTLVVEQDVCEIDPFESLIRSYQYITTLLEN